MDKLGLVKEQWNEWSDSDWYAAYRTDEKIAKIISNPESAFHHITYAMIKNVLPNLEGKRICVPSSGDNHAVFAFHLMGARATSCDISERQVENAATIARRQGWDIEFLCDDTMTLSKLGDGEYDLVYTSNGVLVWIHDLPSMYRNINRVLKDDGAYIMYDLHPFTRPFGDDTEKITVVKPYDSIGPSGQLNNYTWRIQDILNAMVSSGLNIKHVEEMYAEYNTYWFESNCEREKMSKEEIDRLYQWEQNPLAAIPQWLSIYVSK